MNLSTVPKEEMEKLQNQPMAKKLGPIYGWSEEQFYTVVAHTNRIPFREIRIEEVDAETFHQKQEFFIRASQIPLKRYPDVLIVSESEPWDERKLQELIQEFEAGRQTGADLHQEL